MKTFKYKIIETPSKDILLVLYDEDGQVVLGKFDHYQNALAILDEIISGSRDSVGNKLLIDKEVELESE